MALSISSAGGRRVARILLLTGNLVWLVPTQFSGSHRLLSLGVAVFVATGFLAGTWNSTGERHGTAGYLPAVAWLVGLDVLAGVLVLIDGSRGSVAFLYPALVAVWMLPVGRVRMLVIVLNISMIPLMLLVLGGPRNASPPFLFGIAATFAANLHTARYARILWQRVQEQRDLAEVTARQERMQMMREFHDILGQELTLIAISADQALTDGNATRQVMALEEIRTRSKSAFGKVATALRGSERISLETELERAATAFALRGIACHRGAGLAPVPVFEPAVGHLLACIVREGSTNVLRHAPDARNCWLDLTESVDEIVLIVVNDGNSFATIAPGFGLIGMQDRMKQQNGTLTVRATGDGLFTLKGRVRR
jgi:two-component system sensor histidine kinase DesK